MKRKLLKAHIWNFLKLTRPLFLGGGVVLFLLGTMIAVVDGARFNLIRFLSGQFLVTTIQLMTHYANEYFDLEGDMQNKSRTWFSGGSGVLTSGALSPGTARISAMILSVIAFLAAVIAGMQVPIVFVLGLLGLAAAWSYSGPPLSLVRTGWGEISASLVVAFLVPVVGYAMQSGGKLGNSVIITSLPLILIHLAMLIAFEIPDHDADRAVGKRTLYVRLGPKLITRLHNAVLLLAFCVILWLSITHWPGAQFAWLGLPLAAWQSLSIRRYLHPTSLQFHWLTMGAIALFAVTAGLWLAGYAWLVFIT